MVVRPEIFLAFFKAKSGNWADKLIGLVDGGKFSHVELVIRRTDERVPYYTCFSSHMSDGGVRVKQLLLDDNKWELIPLPEEYDTQYAIKLFQHNIDGKYDWLGLFTTILNWWPHGRNRWFCSELIATMLKLPHPERCSVEDLYKRFK